MAKFVTIATFGEVPKAEIARNILAEGGVKSYLSDSELVAMDWLIANAIGGVKVQVAAEDAERAIEILAQAKEMQSNIADDGISEEELTRQAMEAEPEDEVEASNDALEQPPLPLTAETPATEEVLNRDDYAKRYQRSALFGFAFLPLFFYAVYLGLNAMLGSGPISPLGRRNILLGSFLIFLHLPFWLFIAYIGDLGYYYFLMDQQ